MPIIEIEIMLKQNESIREDLASDLADKLGEILNSPRGTTWVKHTGFRQINIPKMAQHRKTFTLCLSK